MTHFTYVDGRLCAEGVALERIAAEIGTPFYCYSSTTLIERYKAYEKAFARHRARICYAMKANSNQAVIATLGRLGAGADVVSGGELHRALAAGIPAQHVVFAGVGKTRDEMAAALDAGILQFNVESLPELEALDAVARARGVRAPVSLRINPDVDARTHAKISTGKAENKFGIELGLARDVATRAAAMAGIELCGLAVHIGSQLTDVAPFRASFARIANLAEELIAAGLPIRRLDLGGGLGVSYTGDPAPALEDYAAAVDATVGPLGLELIFEPGRWLAAPAGVLVSRVVYVKEGVSRSFLILDAAMNDLLRPALYDAYHPILPVAQPPSDAATRRYDVVGPICESGDTFARERPLPPLAAGDLVAFCAAGAYGAVMSSTYNTRPLPPEVMVSGHDYAIVRARQTYDDILALERLPGWLAGGLRSRGAA
jgi:diaminopimelate decarboxylase